MLLGLNISLLLALLYLHIFSKDRISKLEHRLKTKLEYNFDDLVPTITYSKDDRVDVGFRQVKDEKNQKLSNCINPNVQEPKKKLEAMIACLPLFKEHRSNSKAENIGMIKDIPNFVPKFGEAISVSMHYPYKDIKWKNLYKTPLRSENILNKLNFYNNPVQREMYDDDPNTAPDFDVGHMGIFNMGDYCNVHDILIQYHPALALEHKYFITDYHQMGLPRMFVMNKIGEDLMPKISKNMPKLNFYQKLYPLDFRANMFFFKKASFHTHHMIGRNFACFGQSYNHIPGHGALVRKDLLNKYSMEWVQKFAPLPSCKAQMDYFVGGYRLYVQNECKEFFKLVLSSEYQKKKTSSPIQYIMKVGYGVHRGEGVFLLDAPSEKSYLEQYENGNKCGQINENILAQKYIDNPFLYKGHKFDFRIYMLISSVNPLKVYYHDGFLRISLFKYSKNPAQKGAAITNTELSKMVIKRCEKFNETHDGMNADELREFQMKTLDELNDYVNEIKKVNDTKWLDNYLRVEFEKAFLSVAKMVEKRIYNSSDVFEMYGVDFVIDDDLKVYIIEINASPMIVGTNQRKTELMANMLNGMFNITFAQQYSRTKSGLDFIKENHNKIQKAKKAERLKLSEDFKKLYRNNVSKEYEHMLENNPWYTVYDGSLNGTAKYQGLITDECANFVDSFA